MIQFEKLPFNVGNTWMTSDIHGFHKNIAKGSSTWEEDHSSSCRDFKNEIEMTEHIVNQINKYVKEDDLLINCGDWSFGGKGNIFTLRNMIKCKNIILIQGNHDHNITNSNDQEGLFYDFQQIGYYQVDHIKFVTCHYPMSIWHQSHKDVPLFYGHVHGSFKNVGKSLDVGIDNIFNLTGEYKPISLVEADKIARSNKTFLESHHQKNTN